MKKNWVLSQEAFDTLLDWLDTDREQAGQKYEDIRQRLIRIFTSRKCWDAEDLADETINRVASKVPEIRDTYSGDPALFFYSVAQHIYREWLRRKPPPVPPLVPVDSASLEKQSRCLEECLEFLPPQNRELVVQYYHDEKQAKIERRKRLAQRLNIAPNALRIRACRIRAELLKCVEKCLDKENK
jgi:DNA-directed RNA polymerase specialized sigma24 family protein